MPVNLANSTSKAKYPLPSEGLSTVLYIHEQDNGLSRRKRLSKLVHKPTTHVLFIHERNLNLGHRQTYTPIQGKVSRLEHICDAFLYRGTRTKQAWGRETTTRTMNRQNARLAGTEANLVLAL